MLRDARIQMVSFYACLSLSLLRLSSWPSGITADLLHQQRVGVGEGRGVDA